MNKERAAQIYNYCVELSKPGFPWSDFLDKVMTPQERQYVCGLWATRGGNSTFAGTFLEIANGKEPPIDKADESRKVYESASLTELCLNMEAIQESISSHRLRIATAKKHGLGDSLLARELLKNLNSDFEKLAKLINRAQNHFIYLTKD